MRTALLASLLLIAGAHAAAQALSVEGGVDALRQNFITDGGEVIGDAELGPSVAVSGYVQVPALRSYYGLLLAGHSGRAALRPDEGSRPGEDVSQTTLTAMAGWRGFPFDLEGDCDCPTWREENWFRKAFFLEAGLGYGRQTFADESGTLSEASRSGAAYFARAGLAHRLGASLDLFAGLGYQGIVGRDVGYGVHHGAARPSIGFIWRP